MHSQGQAYKRFDLALRVGGLMWEAWGSAPLRPSPVPPAAQGGAWELAGRQKVAAVNTRTDLKSSPKGVSGRAVHLPPPATTGGRYREATADEAHLSGFLESGHTKNSSSTGSKARGGPSVPSLRSADGCDPDPRRHLRATADGSARVLRSAEGSPTHAALSIVGQPATAPHRPHADRGASGPPARPRPSVLWKRSPSWRELALWFRGRS